MKNLFTFCFLVFSLSFASAQSQIEKILNDPNVVWVSEYTIDADPSQDREDNLARGYGYTFGTLLKYVSQHSKMGNDPHGILYDNRLDELDELLFENRAETLIYQDKYLKKKYSKQEAIDLNTYVDTITTSPSSEAPVKTVVKKINSYKIIGLRQYGIVYYHKKDARFYTKVISMAPICHFSDSKIMPLFWVAVEETDKTDLASKDIEWASRIIHHIGGDGKVLAQKEDYSFEKAWISHFAELKTDYDQYNCYDAAFLNPLSAKGFQQIVTAVDTIVSFDPVTFEEKIEVKTQEFKGDDIEYIRIVQDWVWDNKKKQVFVRYLAYAPMATMYDTNNIFYKRYGTAMLYILMPGVK